MWMTLMSSPWYIIWYEVVYLKYFSLTKAEPSNSSCPSGNSPMAQTLNQICFGRGAVQGSLQHRLSNHWRHRLCTEIELSCEGTYILWNISLHLLLKLIFSCWEVEAYPKCVDIPGDIFIWLCFSKFSDWLSSIFKLVTLGKATSQVKDVIVTSTIEYRDEPVIFFKLIWLCAPKTRQCVKESNITCMVLPFDSWSTTL